MAAVLAVAVTVTAREDVLTRQARLTAGELLAAELPRRWRHTQAVAARAEFLAVTVAEADRPLLTAAAWLHDIGYCARLRDSGFHPLDGARWLERRGWPPRLTALVAHHSGALHIARAQGLAAPLARYPVERSPVADALAYADQTTGPSGQPMLIVERLADMLRRHGPDSPQATAHAERGPYLLDMARRVEQRLAEHREGQQTT